jgi:predicted chitinase
MAGEVTGYNQIIPLNVLESLPAEKKIKIETPQQSGSPTVVNWWQLEGVLGGTDNQVLNGWVREQDLISTRHNPWEWEGFAFLEETSTNLQNWASYLHAQDSLTEDEKSAYKPAPTGPVKERLYDIIDADKNDKLTFAEIKGALGRPWHAQSISQLVVKYESEWLYKADKWNSLDQYMGSPNPKWDAEKVRIEKLAWWGDLAGKQGVSADGKVWHLHPVGVLAYLGARGSCSCSNGVTQEQLKNIAPTASLANIEKYTDSIAEMFKRFGIAKCVSKVHVLAQMLHESGALQFVTEGLDPTKPNPLYYPYIGRGLIQVTGEGNYSAYGTSVGENFIGNPDMLKMANPPHCVVSVGWYWVDFKSLLVHSDRDDFIYCTARVNGGSMAMMTGSSM